MPPATHYTCLITAAISEGVYMIKAFVHVVNVIVTTETISYKHTCNSCNLRNYSYTHDRGPESKSCWLLPEAGMFGGPLLLGHCI